MTALVLVLLVVIIAPLTIEARRRPMDAAARLEAEGEFANLSQGITHYQWLGPMRGPVAVCVHGLTTPSFVWYGVAEGLARMGFRVLIYDLYGRGYSDRVPGRQDRAFFQRQLADLLADQQVGDDITLLGYSMGGAIATDFTAEHPGRVRRLVLLASAGIRTRPDAMARFITKTPLIGDWLMLALFPRRHRKSTEAERALPGTVENIVERQQRELAFRGFIPAVLASMRGILSETFQQQHRAIHKAGVPVLAIWGGKDVVIPLTAMSTLATWSRNARQEVINEAGHGLPYTHTEVILNAMSETLRDGLA